MEGVPAVIETSIVEEKPDLRFSSYPSSLVSYLKNIREFAREGNVSLVPIGGFLYLQATNYEAWISVKTDILCDGLAGIVIDIEKLLAWLAIRSDQNEVNFKSVTEEKILDRETEEYDPVLKKKVKKIEHIVLSQFKLVAKAGKTQATFVGQSTIYMPHEMPMNGERKLGGSISDLLFALNAVIPYQELISKENDDYRNKVLLSRVDGRSALLTLSGIFLRVSFLNADYPNATKVIDARLLHQASKNIEVDAKFWFCDNCVQLVSDTMDIRLLTENRSLDVTSIYKDNTRKPQVQITFSDTADLLNCLKRVKIMSERGICFLRFTEHGVFFGSQSYESGASVSRVKDTEVILSGNEFEQICFHVDYLLICLNAQKGSTFKLSMISPTSAISVDTGGGAYLFMPFFLEGGYPSELAEMETKVWMPQNLSQSN